MRNALRRVGLVCLLAVFTFSVYATNAIALASTNFIDPELTAENPQVKQLTEAMKKEGFKPDSILNAQYLFASLLWGSVGGGYLLYARKQREAVPFLGGVAMIAVSFFVTSWFWMSLVCLALMAGVWQLMKRCD